MEKQEKKVRKSESQKSGEEGRRLHFAFLAQHSVTYLIQMLIQSEHSPTKAPCEVKLFIHLHKKHVFYQMNGFCWLFVQYVCVCDGLKWKK